MLKRLGDVVPVDFRTQPPSGGCVLKLNSPVFMRKENNPAAFRRLCVETERRRKSLPCRQPAAFRRLCVETVKIDYGCFVSFPAAFRRLCVETKHDIQNNAATCPAAFRRLCVETMVTGTVERERRPSRLQAAVC